MNNDLWKKILYKNSLKEGRIRLNDPSDIDGKNREQAKNMIYKRIAVYTKGSFNDEYWRAVKNVWDEFDRMNLNWWIDNSKYVKNSNGVPVRKEWKFTIDFEDNRGKKAKIGGVIIAHSTGSVKDPLDKYSVTVTLY